MEQARPGKYLGDIGAAIQEYCEKEGFSTVREYTGHGVGRSLHEEPFVLHFAQKGPTLKLRPGTVFTDEQMINAGRPETRVKADRWTVCTADGQGSARFVDAISVPAAAPAILS